MYELVRRVCRLTLALAAGLVIAPLAAAQAGARPPVLLWADQIPLDAGGVADAVAVQGPATLVVTGPAPGDPGTSELRAYDTGTGEALWRRAAVALPGQTITGLEAGRSTAFVVSTAGESNALALRARAALDGFNEWTRIAFLPVSRIAATDVVLSGPRVFVLGNADDQRLVRALEAESGALLWSDTPYEDDPDFERETVSAGTVDDGRLVVTGSRRRMRAGDGSTTFVRQYRVRDGGVLWDTEIEGDETTIGGIAGAVSDAMVVAATTVDPTTGEPRWVSHAVDAGTGEPLWSDTPYRLPSAAEAVAYDSETHTAFVAGWVRGARTLPVIRAHDASTGALLWEGGGGGVNEGSFRDLTLVDGAIVAVGSGRRPGVAVQSPLLEGLDPETGASLWSRVDAAEDGRGRLDAVHAHGKWIAVAGRHRPRGELGLLHVYALDE